MQAAVVRGRGPVNSWGWTDNSHDEGCEGAGYKQGYEELANPHAGFL